MIRHSFARRRLGATYVSLVVTLLAGAALAFAAPGGTSAHGAGRASELGLLAFTAPLTTPTPIVTPPIPTVPFIGRLGAFVQVADACSYYPLTQCDGTVVQISQVRPNQLSAYVGKDVRVETVTAVCGSSIAGQPLYGPVAVYAQLVGPCAPAVEPKPCPFITNRVPAAVINAAIASPAKVLGWGTVCNPAVPVSPSNPRRSNLSLVNFARPYHPTYNSVVFKCGCP